MAERASLIAALPRKRLLQTNPAPIKVVPDAVREVWNVKSGGFRCDHEDGRGRCTSVETRSFWNEDERMTYAYCEKHRPEWTR